MYSKPFLDGVEYYEGFYPRRYLDPVGKWTIGIGHLIVPGDRYTDKTGLTHDQAVEQLLQDLEQARTGIMRNYPGFTGLTQSQQEALVSWVFNLGIGRFRESTMFKRLKAQQYDAVPSEMARWVYGTLDNGDRVKLPGLVKRRRWEGNVFATGNYTIVTEV